MSYTYHTDYIESTLALKARISLRRECVMLRLINMYTSRIREATTLEEAKFFNALLIDGICFASESPQVQELEDELKELQKVSTVSTECEHA